MHIPFEGITAHDVPRFRWRGLVAIHIAGCQCNSPTMIAFTFLDCKKKIVKAITAKIRTIVSRGDLLQAARDGMGDPASSGYCTW